MRSANFADLRPGDVVEHEDGRTWEVIGYNDDDGYRTVDVIERCPVTTWYGKNSWNRLAKHARQVEEKEA